MLRTFLKPLSFIPAILLMYMIFSFSAQEGEVSSAVSYKASHFIVETADHIFDMGLDDYQISYFATKIHGVTRKLAHMGEYFLLAIAVSFPLYVYGLHGILLMILAGGICIAFACGDEYHQSFVAGRAASMKDVGIDSIGVFIGIILVRIIGWTGRKTIFRPEARKEKYKLTRKERKQLQAMQNRPYPNDSFQNPPYPMEGFQSQPYHNDGFQNQPYRNDGFQNQPYRNGGFQNQPYPMEGFQSQPYHNGGFQNQPYHNGGFQNQPYYNGSFQNQPYPMDGQSGYYDNRETRQAPEYMEYPEHSSDELSEDMPLSHLLKPKK